MVDLTLDAVYRAWYIFIDFRQPRACGKREMPMSLTAEPTLKTDRLGGVGVPAADTFKTIHDSSYILYIQPVVGSSQAGESREAGRNNTDSYALRWSPMKQLEV